VRTVSVPFTLSDYAKLPEGFPAQLVGGSLVKDASPSWSHQGLVLELVVLLRPRLGRRVLLPVDVVVDDENVYQPDVAVYRDPPPRTGSPLRHRLVPAVVFEVLSPTTERRDRTVKRRGYLRAGIEEVWLVDPESARVEVHRGDGVTTYERDARATSRAIPEISFVVAELFDAA
jgi:Uma2 family endonuclease